MSKSSQLCKCGGYMWGRWGYCLPVGQTNLRILESLLVLLGFIVLEELTKERSILRSQWRLFH